MIWQASSATLNACSAAGRGSNGGMPCDGEASKAKALSKYEYQWGYAEAQFTSGRCCSIGSLYSNLARRTSFNVEPVGRDCIWRIPSSSHARMRVFRARSPEPNKALTAVSESGWECASGGGKSSTERARASRVKPCVLMSGTERRRSLELEGLLAHSVLPLLRFLPRHR